MKKGPCRLLGQFLNISSVRIHGITDGEGAVKASRPPNQYFERMKSPLVIPLVNADMVTAWI